MRFTDFRLRARAFFRPRNVERELDDELGFHIECETRKLLAEGLSAAEARRRALARFGPVPLAADQCRDERGISFFETLARDVSFALRMLRRAPLVAVTVVSTIALGLGVVTVAFTFFNAFFFQVDAVRNPDELFAVERLERPDSRSEVPFSRSEYEAIRRDTDVFTDVAAARPSFPTRVRGTGAPGEDIAGRAAVAMFVSGNFFEDRRHARRPANHGVHASRDDSRHYGSSVDCVGGRLVAGSDAKSYTPYLYANKLFSDRFRDAVGRTWPAYLDGTRTLTDADRDLVRMLSESPR